MEINEHIRSLMENPEKEFEFLQETNLPGAKNDLVRIRYVPQGDNGFFQATFFDEEREIVGSRVFDEVEDVAIFIEKNKI
ncbi:hypothetical protein [Fictibacillus fluitans]|uniref:Uncharacterized protein n=1 Tax=Fictibacillus fluitans TaxID=3058422 RepID=A0ABT8HSV4_9BACL|nr:hypothetical protein [Fictibacillus sp. NE201]MDN4523831.1 hypothetical protein [Fictibacillus sp. NE201]